VYSTLRTEIEQSDQLAPSISELSTATLDGTDVFYTSLLRDGDVLSTDEQSALFDWLYTGGTLIVTGDTLALDFYTSFTAAFGVDLYVAVGNNGVGTIVADHPLTASVTTLLYVSNASFAFDANAVELAQSAEGYVLAAVIEPDPESCTTGRILVLGDHHMFTDTYVSEQDNLQFLRNVVQWAGETVDLSSCCGNGHLDPTEECDDGNSVPGDGCENDCTASPGSSSTGADSTGGPSTGIPDPTSDGTSDTTSTSTSSGSTTAGVTSIETATGFTAGPPEPEEDEPQADDGGCGCASGPASPGSLWWMVVLVSRRRSRRGRR
jgi:cysteine-rich repeat protein